MVNSFKGYDLKFFKRHNVIKKNIPVTARADNHSGGGGGGGSGTFPAQTQWSESIVTRVTVKGEAVVSAPWRWTQT